MRLRPTIFLSSVSSEFASFRDAAEIEVQKKGCFPLNEPSFGVDYREIEELLRRHLSEADAMIQIVGFRYGSEPKARPEDKPRRSYTQIEYDIARELNIPVYVFLAADANVRDPNPDQQPEDAEVVQLQLAYRQFLDSPNHIRYSFNDKNHLRALVAGIPLLATADFRVDISRIDKYAPAELIGREDELTLLNNAWLKVRRAEPKRPHILTFVALGGEGKTSLVAKWAAELAYEKWPACDSAFAWSFYSQGTREQYAASSDLFLKEAITFFGNEKDAEFAASNAGAYEKGQRLARIVGQRRSLLILDGLEPLQYAPTSPTPGELKDSGIAALLRALAADSDGLCIVTTRYSLPNLKAFWQTTAPETRLLRLSPKAGVSLLKKLGVNGKNAELDAAVEDVRGHALTLNLLGTYLRDAHGGDIRKRDLIRLEEADAEEQGGHAFRVVNAYEEVLENERDKGKRALAILRLLGCFDSTVDAGCFYALLEEPAIPGLTEPLVGLTDAQRNLAFQRLEDAQLLSVHREVSGELAFVDAHPLLREYFACQLREHAPDAWRAAHLRLYKHLRETTPDKAKPTLEDLQPLYQAIAHGCEAGLYQEVFHEIYVARISRGNEFYASKKLGAIASEMGALARFFTTPWRRVSPAFTKDYQATLLNLVSLNLRASGRLMEALEPTRAAVQEMVKLENWTMAAQNAINLSELELTLGEVDKAVEEAAQSVIYADREGELFRRMTSRAAYADALHHNGRAAEAQIQFQVAQELQKELNPEYSHFHSFRNFRYCDLLLGTVARSAWQCALRDKRKKISDHPTHSETLRLVLERAAYSLEIDERNNWIFDVSLDHLTMSRTLLYAAVLSKDDPPSNAKGVEAKTMAEEAVSGLRRSGQQPFVPLGLLTRAWVRFVIGMRTGAESTKEDLDEAWEIAERGPMKLHMADIHLYRARLFFREAEYPWESPLKDLEAAEKLINECAYHRRDEELADAKRVILNQSV